MPIAKQSFDRKILGLDERNWNRLVEADAVRVSQFGKFISIRSLATTTTIIYSSLKAVAEEGVTIDKYMVELYSDAQSTMAAVMTGMFEKLIEASTCLTLPNAKEDRMTGLFGAYHKKALHMVIRENVMAFDPKRMTFAPMAVEFVPAVGEKFIILRATPAGMDFTFEDSCVFAIGENSLADLSPSLARYVQKVSERAAIDEGVVDQFQELSNVICPSRAKAEQIKNAQEKYGQSFGSWA